MNKSRTKSEQQRNHPIRNESKLAKWYMAVISRWGKRIKFKASLGNLVSSLSKALGSISSTRKETEVRQRMVSKGHYLRQALREEENNEPCGDLEGEGVILLREEWVQRSCGEQASGCDPPVYLGSKMEDRIDKEGASPGRWQEVRSLSYHCTDSGVPLFPHYRG